MKLRRGDSDDAFAIAQVWLRSRAASVPAIPPPIHTGDVVHAWFEQVVLPTKEVWVAEGDGEIVALLVLEPGWIDQLYVEPDHTGRGLGARLIEVAKQRRPAGLKLWSFEANVGARRFYGWRQRGGGAGHPLRVAPA